MTGALIRGRLDRSGHLVSADPALLRLQERAGGRLAGPLVLPQLARLAAMAQHLGREINRPLMTADDHSDINAWVRILPDADGVQIEIGDWRARPIAAAGSTYDTDTADTSAALPAGGWHWECDQQLRLVRLADADGQAAVSGWEGRSLSEIFVLMPDVHGKFPVLHALAQQEAFVGQRAQPPVEVDAQQRVMLLSADARGDAAGTFTGFRGVAVVSEERDAVADSDRANQPHGDQGQADNLQADLGQVNAAVDPAFGSLPLSDPRFGRRIDGALRGPLSRIIASAETISGQFEGPIRADYARYAGDIAHAARHLLGLIDDLADLQNIERPGFKAAREAVDLADIARRAVGLLMMKAEEKAIRIDVPAIGETMPAIGEFRRVLQVLLNLIGNAIRYSPEGSTIWVRVDMADALATVTVADQGRGLSVEQQAVVFEKFERLGRTDTGGSGLGLYIARRLSRAMDGELTVESAPGQGARFTLCLPVRDPDQP